MYAKSRRMNDPARFEGNGISYRAKLIGIEDVSEARGDRMCQETIQKLKNGIKISGQHKRRIFVNVTLEGLKIIDAVSMLIQYTHPVHRISFISRDITDSRAFGYIYGPGDGTHKFFGIKTANAAENLVLALRDLFQTVYEMKKKEIEEAKTKAGIDNAENPETTYQVPANGAPVEGKENIYQVPQNNAPVNPQEQEEAVANLLDLEDQADSILKGIEQIKNLDFDELREEETKSSASGSAADASPTDPWGMPALPSSSSTATSALSSLSDLQLLDKPPASNNLFDLQAFPGTPVPSVGITAPAGMFSVPQAGGAPFPIGQTGFGPSVTKDPFGDDPFSSQPVAQIPQQMPASNPMQFALNSGFANPFQNVMARPTQGQPFPGMVALGALPGSAAFGPAMPGVTPFGPAMAGVTPFGPAAPGYFHGGVRMGFGGNFAQPAISSLGGDLLAGDTNLLQPLRQNGQNDEQQDPQPKAGYGDFFGDLVDIKKTAGASTTTKTPPKDLFKTAPPKKSLNQIKAEESKPVESAKASDDLDPAFSVDPFGSLDAVLSTASAEVDPFSIAFSPERLPAFAHPSDPLFSLDSCKRSIEMDSQKELSPEDWFDMPDEPPPPLPTHLQFCVIAPTPPPRPPPRDKNEHPVPQQPLPKPRRSTSSASSVSSHSSSSTAFPPSCNALQKNNPSALPPPQQSSPRSTIRSPSPVASEFSSSSSVFDANSNASTFSQNMSAGSSPVIVSTSPHVDSQIQNGSPFSSSYQINLMDSKALDFAGDDPFGVPLRTKKCQSVSLQDGSKKSVQSSVNQMSVLDDPFALVLPHRFYKTEQTIIDDPYSCKVFGDCDVLTKKLDKWEAFTDFANGTSEGSKFTGFEKSAVSSDDVWVNSSPFGDSFLTSAPFTPFNGED